MIRWFAGHPTAANLLLLAFVAAGAMAAPTLVRETFPDFRSVEAEIVVAYRGATAEDVEAAICAPLWDAVQSVESLAEFTCTAQANTARGLATMAAGGDALRFVNALRTEVAAVDSLPDRADPATVRELHRTDPVASVAVSGALPPEVLDSYAEELSDRIAALPGVARVLRSGLGQRTVRIEADRAVLAQHGLTAAALAGAVGAQSLDLPAGTLESAGATLTLRFTEERRTAAALATIPVLSLANGATLLLGDVARIEARFEPPEEAAFVDGRPAILLEVHKPLGADGLRTLDAVTALIAAERAGRPDTLRLEIVQDVTSIVRDRLTMLVENGILGFVLVLAAMGLFFRPAFAFWAAMGLPVAFLGAIVWMSVTGLSLNMMTMVALLMAIGIVMDDSIVIADSVAMHTAGGVSVGAVAAGVGAVAPGVVASFLTTVAVFLPLSFLAGNLGAVLEVLPVVLLAALAASLIEAFLILPHHLRGALSGPPRPPWRLHRWVERGFALLRDHGVVPLARAAVAGRWLVAGLALGGLLATIGALAGGVVKREAMPEIDGDIIEARILMPAGTPLGRTAAAVAQVEAALAAVNAALTPGQPGGARLVERTITRMGRNVSAGEGGSHVATVAADLLGAEDRATTLDELVAAWRQAIGVLPGVASLILAEPGIGPQGLAIELRLTHHDLDMLAAAGRAALAEIETYAGVRNAMTDLRPGRPELRLTLGPGARALGLTASDVAGQLRAAFLGTVLADVREGGLAHAVEVILASADRDALGDLEAFTIVAADGTAVPLTTVADIAEGRGWGTIIRRDGRRTLTVQADVDGRVGNADAITALLAAGFLPALAADTPGLGYAVGGQAANAAETTGSILRGFLVGLVGIYAVLSFQFRSYGEPLIVMVTIPLALVGVVWGHWAMGYNISMPSLMGAGALAGIVVNNAILLVGVIKEHAAAGRGVAAAAVAAVQARFRPIVLSVTTTILGMAPLLAETSTQAQTLIPLVIAMVFGLLASTVLVLVVLPALYAIIGSSGDPGERPPAAARATS